MFFTYHQGLVHVLFDGIPLTDLGEGASVKVTVDGGEVEKTQGTDGAAVNVGTLQGATVKVIFKETSSAHAILMGQILAQQVGAPGGVLTIVGGTATLHSLANAYVSAPGELSTGDKKMGSQEYTFTSAFYVRGG